MPDEQPQEPESMGVDPVLGPLCIATRFLLPMDAQIFAARLHAEGISAHVMDANTVYTDGFAGGFGSGGVRVMVPRAQLEEAQRILAAFNAGEYAIDETFDPDAD
jgi:hypothetical protein